MASSIWGSPNRCLLWNPFGSILGSVLASPNRVPKESTLSMLGSKIGLLGPPGPSWCLLGPPRASWSLLGPPGASWHLLEPTEASWRLLKIPGASWGLLGSPVASWRLLSLLEPPGASWSLLGPPGVSCGLLDRPGASCPSYARFKKKQWFLCVCFCMYALCTPARICVNETLICCRD